MPTRWWFLFVLALIAPSLLSGLAIGNPIPVGACCLYGGECVMLQEEDCYAQGGLPMPDVWSCEPNPCWGACCTEFGTCMVTDYVNCVVPMGMFLGSGSTCDADPCHMGACCLIDGTCAVLHEGECLAQGGTYFYDMYPCSLTPCVTEGIGIVVPAAPFACTATPNPFTTGTTITLAWSGSRPGEAGFTGVILDAAGRLVRGLTLSSIEPGRFVCRWDGRDDAGQPAPAGVYFVRVRAGERTGSAALLRLR